MVNHIGVKEFHNLLFKNHRLWRIESPLGISYKFIPFFHVNVMHAKGRSIPLMSAMVHPIDSLNSLRTLKSLFSYNDVRLVEMITKNVSFFPNTYT
ncbi:hypothetical protein Scep_027829 [Stephania cephalantha]|uniref:Uncharacterized protein n=1 Tax=Stephania cephalantha TaxID=152367 RepID=A0AAP0EC14_9MAGN